MATVDARKGDESFHGEVYLKLWWWDKKSGSWTLNTRIDRPHGLTKVTSTAFSPVQDITALQLVSTGRDGYIKTWRVRKEKTKNANEGLLSLTNSQMELIITLKW
jgi:NET1-associated nuclear protein 1 (U3 small nucleolar RNA-associated protein 17)